MRIVIDMQGAQTESRFRGIGLDTMSFARAVAGNRGGHEIILALSGLFPDTIEPIRAAFDGLLPQENIRVWYAPGPVREIDPDNDTRRRVAELVREAFLASLCPDVILIGSFFEGYSDAAVTSIGRFDPLTPVGVLVTNAAPLVLPGQHIDGDEPYLRYLQRKTQDLGNAAVCLTFITQAALESTEVLQLVTSKLVDLALNKRYAGELAGAPSDPAPNEVEYGDIGKLVDDPLFCGQCAGRVIDECEAVFNHWKTDRVPEPSTRRPRLAFISPLPPERTGIADYSAELLPALARFYEIEVVTDQVEISDPWIVTNCVVRSVSWFSEYGCDYERVLYHMGNSQYHAHMFELIRKIPGTVVLHDFFLSGAQWSRENLGLSEHAWTKALYESHGYKPVQDRFENPHAEEVVRDYPANFGVIRAANGVIVHSDYARRLGCDWYGEESVGDWSVVPILRHSADRPDRVACRRALGIDEKAFVVCSFGFIGPTKCNHKLLEAWHESELSKQKDCILVFVGALPDTNYGHELRRQIRSSRAEDRIRVTGYVEPYQYRQHLGVADVAVQLRGDSRGETSAAVLDCMNHALAVIVNANGAMDELDHDAVWMLPDPFDVCSLRNALNTLWRDAPRRMEIGSRARESIRWRNAPEKCASLYTCALERYWRRGPSGTARLIRKIGYQDGFDPRKIDMRALAGAIDCTIPGRRPSKSLFLDVTATFRNDLKTGIERVARALLLALLEDSPGGYRVEPVYLWEIDGEWHHRTACRYTLALLGCPETVLRDERVQPQCGDVVLTLDLSGDHFTRAVENGLFRDYRNRGVKTYAIVYDLLPVLMPEMFPPGMKETHEYWLRAVSKLDGANCISQSVARELRHWMEEYGEDTHRLPPFSIDWFHLGADIDRSAPTRGLPRDAASVLRQLRARPTFLMVGTIEPRKRHLQVLDAFARFWGQGIDVNLAIVGKEGWQGLPQSERRTIPELVARLRDHPEAGKRLFWLEETSDEYLSQVYDASTCLIAASYGEGFGLPLIEAARHRLPIIARDIAVFREVAGEHAFYFQGVGPEELAKAILEWLRLHAEEGHPRSDDISWITWSASAREVVKQLAL